MPLSPADLPNQSRSEGDDGCVIFLHIAKAGGTTFEAVLDNQYPPESIYALDNWDTVSSIQRLSATPRDNLRHVRLLRGHMPFGLHQYIPSPSRYITFLRDPVERMTSHFYFVLQTPLHYLHQTVMEQKMDLAAYVLSGISPELDNSQTKAISGNFTHFGCCTRDDLETAKANIRDWFEVTGITERYDESLLLMKRRLHWRNDPYYVSANITSSRPAVASLPESTIDSIRQVNQLDMELYEYALSLHKVALEAEGPQFAEELAQFQRRNRDQGKR